MAGHQFVVSNHDFSRLSAKLFFPEEVFTDVQFAVGPLGPQGNYVVTFRSTSARSLRQVTDIFRSFI